MADLSETSLIHWNFATTIDPVTPPASSDHVARLWEMATGETVRQYNGHHKGAPHHAQLPSFIFIKCLWMCAVLMLVTAAVCCALHDGAG